ncbi:tRNA(Ile)-lysidine synthase [Virgisporangium aliadipatigenens]|uniref:tRNA(Ile)-lysidine synthase n=1 Tax=Virgisporangium aliadipatigenens TaxID=741659 RepID=A0A8J3YYB2_9ACTN|nr:tRNA lysidine(34) synthetase TilS [Virgisporangium aliadipatigenens]GIJ51803.1 tRNA(Ile)-lysidine synthase [Virgisporangium aliadipatigenens]
MAGLAPPVAAVRVAVRRALLGERPERRVLIACSGGADSLALAAAAAFVAPRLGLHCGLITVDHRLQEGSGARAESVAAWGREAGLAPSIGVAVDVTGRPGGPEAAARAARYEALCATAREVGASTVLLGHTRDDQAETVLLALARGGGPRGLAGMPSRREIDGIAFLRPLLDIRRAETRAACLALGLTPWDDPHNADPAFARARVRGALPTLVHTLGPKVIDNLARAAALIAADNAALDALAARAAEAARDGDGLSAATLAAEPAATRTRVLRLYAAELGAKALSQRHIAALDALVCQWRGQGPVALPGGIRVARRDGRLLQV